MTAHRSTLFSRGGLLTVAGVTLIPWSGLLAARGHKWWAVYDVVQSAVLMTGGRRLLGNQPSSAKPVVTAAAGLLVFDAVIDIVTAARHDAVARTQNMLRSARRSRRGPEAQPHGSQVVPARLPLAVAFAVFAELPMAAICCYIAARVTPTSA